MPSRLSFGKKERAKATTRSMQIGHAALLTRHLTSHAAKEKERDQGDDTFDAERARSSSYKNRKKFFF